MITLRTLAFSLTVSIAGIAQADCPDPQDVSAEMQALFAKARSAKSHSAGQQVGQEMWQVWLRAPDEAAQEVLDNGLARRDAFDFVGAMKHFDRLAEYCPTYAEGFNQRAYVNFLRENYEPALQDLDRALALQPNHVAAQAGRALTLLRLGRLTEAREQLLIAVANNPWLSERALLVKGAPLAPQYKDI